MSGSVFLEKLSFGLPCAIKLIPLRIVDRGLGLKQHLLHLRIKVDPLLDQVKDGPVLNKHFPAEIFLIMHFSPDATFETSLANWTLYHMRLRCWLLISIKFLCLERIDIMLQLYGRCEVPLPETYDWLTVSIESDLTYLRHLSRLFRSTK